MATSYTMRGNEIIGTSGDDKITWTRFITYYRPLVVKVGKGNDIINFKKSSYKNKLYGEGGKDIIYGGTNKDAIYGGSGSDKLYGYAGNDVLYAGTGSDSVNGGKGNDKIYGQSGKNILKGGSGNDTIAGGTGNDTIYGGSGADVIDASKGGTNAISGGSGDDKIKGSANTDKIYGGSGNDAIDGKIGNDNIHGGSGNDTMYGGYGNDSLYGEGGADIIYAGSDNDYVDGGDGDDSINGYTGNNTLLGGKGNDTIISGSGSDYIDGGVGNDLIKGISGNNTLLGGSGSDKIYAGSGNDIINGSLDNDYLYAGKGKSTFVFNVGDGVDTIYSGSGIDTIELPSGIEPTADFLIKQGNNLVIKYSDSDKIVLSNYFNGTHSVKYYKIGNGETKLLADEYIYTQGSGTIEGTMYRDSIVGSNSSDVITAGSDKGGHWDVVIPGKESDIVNVEPNGQIYIKFNNGDGNDTVTGAENAKKIVLAIETVNIYGAQEGDDYIITREYLDNEELKTETIVLQNFNFETSKDKVFVSAIDGSNEKPLEEINLDDDRHRVYTTNNEFEVSPTDTISYHVIGDNGGDKITTGVGDDKIEAYDGENIITTSGGSNIITTGNDKDIIKITGGEGDNIIIAGSGNNDIEVAGKTTSITTGSGDDKITVSGTDTNVITSTGGSNTIIATNGNTTINIEGSEDDENSISITGGNNNINSTSAGNDTITVNGSGENHVSLTDGKNVVNMNSDGTSVINGGSDRDIINVTDGKNEIISGGGNDAINLNGGENTVNVADSSAAIVTANGGTNIINGSVTYRNNFVLADGENTINLKSESEKDTIVITGGINTINGTDTNNSFATDSSITDGNNTFNMGAGNDEITIYGGENTVNLGDGADIIYAYGGNNSIDGGKGNDNIYINGLNSTVKGGFGNDNIVSNYQTTGSDSVIQKADITAEAGDDIISLDKYVQETLHFKKGDGSDSIVNSTIPAGEDVPQLVDTLVFDNSNFEDLVFTIENNDLVISYNDGQDKVTIQGYFLNGDVRSTVKYIKALDKTEGVDIESYLKYGIPVQLETRIADDEEIGADYTGTKLNESIRGTSLGDTIDGGEGNDIIRGRNGADVLSDSAGYNIIYGEQGNDTINAFNDSEEGGNTLIFTPSSSSYSGDGVDKIYGFDTGNPLTLRFNVTSFDDLRFEIETTRTASYITEINFVIYYSDNDKVQLGTHISPDETTDPSKATYRYYLSNVNIFVNGEYKTLNDLLDERKYVIDGVNSYIDTQNYQGDVNGLEDNVLYGNSEPNITNLLIGGKGNDTLTSGGEKQITETYDEDNYFQYNIGPNLYVFDKSGDGNDVIYNSNTKYTSYILFTGVGDGPTSVDAQKEFLKTLVCRFSGNDLIIEYGDEETPSSIRIVDYKDKNNKSTISSIRFYYPDENKRNINNCLSDRYYFSEYIYIQSQIEENPYYGSSEYNQKIIGTDDDDEIHPGICNNIILPKKGNDTIVISAAGDEMSDFSENIIYMGTDEKPDILWFKDEKIQNIFAEREGDDLVIQTYSLNYVRLVDYFKYVGLNDTPTFMTLKCGTDGDIYSIADIYENQINNTETKDSIVSGTVFRDSMTLSSEIQETVYGGASNDIINADGGTDSIHGGRGNDIINLNNTGNNTVVVMDEDDEFIETIKNSTSTDTLKLAEDLSGYKFSDLSFEKSENDLIVKTPNNGQIVIQNFFISESKIDNIIALNDSDAVSTYSIKNDATIKITNISDIIGSDYNEEIQLVQGVVDENEDVLNGNTYTSNTNRREYTVNAFALGKGGNDKIYGTVGNDWINGGSGNDTIYGGVGNEDSHDMLSGHDGDNLLIAGMLNSDNTYELTDGSAEMYAREGNDTVVGGNGNDYIDAGTGINNLTGNTGADIFVLRGGEDIITDATSADRIAIIGTTDFADILFSRGADNSTSLYVDYGEHGRLEIQNYFVQNLEGEFVMNESAVRRFILLDENSQNEYILEWRQSNVTGEYSMYRIVEGTNDGDTITAIPGIKNWIDAGGGNDTLFGANTGDMLAGNGGNNTIFAANGAEIYGENGNDMVTAEGNNFIWTHGGNDTMNLVSTGNNTIVLWDADTVDNTTIIGATGTDILKFNIGSNGYKFSELEFQKDEDNLIVNTPNNGKVIIESFFTSESRLDKIIALDDLGNIKNDYSILNDATINMTLGSESTFNGGDYNYNIIGSAEGDIYTISSLAKTTIISDIGGIDELNISLNKSDINLIFNVTKENTFTEGNDKLILSNSTAYNEWKSTGVLPTNGIIINGFESIETINSSDAKLNSLTQLKEDVANWLSTANNGEGYADVATAFANSADISELVAIFERTQNWQ